MKPSIQHPRAALIRKTVIFQLKLLADGLRDAVLIPVSVVAALVGVLRGGNECDREFNRVVDLGRRSEQWINLFGHHPPLESSHPAGSIDSILQQVESVVMDQYRKGKSAAETRAAVREAMNNEDGKASDQ